MIPIPAIDLHNRQRPAITSGVISQPCLARRILNAKGKRLACVFSSFGKPQSFSDLAPKHGTVAERLRSKMGEPGVTFCGLVNLRIVDVCVVSSWDKSHQVTKSCGDQSQPSWQLTG